MKIVIDIPESKYQEYKNYNGFMNYAEYLIKNGVPLEQESKIEGVRGDIPIQPTIPKMPSVQESHKVYISKQEVFEQINCWIGSGEYRYTNATNYLLKRIKKLQSVNPQEPRWTPVSERYPNVEDEYKYFLVTDDKDNMSVQEFFMSLNAEPQPYFSGMINVVAWRELPKSYSKENNS